MLASFLLVALLRFWDTPSPPVHIDPRIFAGKSEGERAEFLVVLRARADLSAAAAIRDRLERRAYVYRTLRAHAETTQAGLRQELERAGVSFRPHFLVNMIEVEADRFLARDLAAREDVSGIELNGAARLVQPRAAEKSPRPAASGATVGVEPNIEKVRAPEMWARGFTGQGVVIAIADTGFEWDHPALKGQYRGWDGSRVTHDYNWHDAIHDAATNPCGSDSTAPCDDNGHGTAVAGIAAGDDGPDNRIGVAPGARLIGCRNMDGGVGTPARYTECFEWLLAPTDPSGDHPRPDLGADVINNSWLCPESEGCTDPEILQTVVENVRAAGVAVVVAAGNDGYACGNIYMPPAIYDASITIGSTDNDDGFTGFSSVGPVNIDGSYRLKPDLCAPGANVRTAKRGGDYEAVSGTSSSTPHVAGAFALLWSAVPALAGDVDATEDWLKLSAVGLTFPYFETDYPPCGGYSGFDVPNPVFGWGRLDVERAYKYITWIPIYGPREVRPVDISRQTRVGPVRP